MSIQMTQVLRRHGALVAGVTAVCVAAAVIAGQLVQALTWPVTFGVMSSGFFWPSLWSVLAQAIPFGGGFFVSLWLVAPIAEQLQLRLVVARAILATGIAATVTFIVLAVLALVGAFTLDGSLFGNTFPFPQFSAGGAAQGVLNALAVAIVGFAQKLPLGVLAGVLLWLWRRGHPSAHSVEGLIDL